MFDVSASAATTGFRPSPTAGDESLALCPFARQLAGPANGLIGLSGPLLGRLLVSPTAFHLAEDAFALQFLFEDPKGLIDVVVSDENLQRTSPSHNGVSIGGVVQWTKTSATASAGLTAWPAGR